MRRPALRDQGIDRRFRARRQLERIHVLDRNGSALEYLQRRGTRIALPLEHLDDAAKRGGTLAGKRAVLLAPDDLARRIGGNVLEVQVRELAVAQQLEVLELALAGPEVKRVEHHPHVRVI